MTTSVSSRETDVRRTSSDISLTDILHKSFSDIEHEDTTCTDRRQTTEQALITKESVKKYVAIIYTEPQLKYYWGKIVNTTESNQQTTKTEVRFLKQKVIGSDPNKWTWYEPAKPEMEVLNVKHVLYGPLIPSIKHNIFTFPDSEASTLLLRVGEDKHL